MYASILRPVYALCISILIVACGGNSSSSNNEQALEKPNENKSDSTMNTSVNDQHSFAQADKVTMTHLDLDIEVDFDQQIIRGKASIHLNNQAQANELYLDTKELDIEKVTLGDQEEETAFKVNKPFQYLGSALKVNIQEDTKLVHVYYQTSPQAEALQWLRPEQTAGKELPYLFTQSQAILARSWVPCQDSPGIRFTYKAKVKVPKELMAVMSADNPKEKNETGVYQFSMPQPVPAYLLALAVGDLEFSEISENTGVYAEPSMLEKSVNEFTDLPQMLEAAEKLYGEYRWGRYDLIVLPPSFPFGGMENPRLTFATPTILAGDRSLTSLVAHELAHSWSGNLVTNATWEDFWLNEGFTVYFERRIMEAIYGEDYAEMLAYLGYQDLKVTLEELGPDSDDTKLKLDLKGRNPDDGVTNIAYEKGYFLLLSIENEIGREKMDTFLTEYFESFAFKTMNTETFVEYITKTLPEIKEVNIEEWIYEPGLPDSAVQISSSRFEKVEETLVAWQEGKAPRSLNTQNWSSHEWLYFLRALPEDINLEQMKSLDEAFGFTQSGNSEILAAWFEKAIKIQYEVAYPALETFLINVGRRKFLVPLYKALTEIEGGQEMALRIYTAARPNYHFVSTNTLDEMLGYEVQG